MSAKQSPADRARRLQKGLCPIHGACLVQIGGIKDDPLAQCSRKDCSVTAIGGPGMGFRLTDEFLYLLQGSRK